MKWIAPLPVLAALVAACGLNASGVNPTGGVSSTSAQGAGGGATEGAGGAGSSSAEASASSGAGGAGGGAGVGGGGGGGDPTWARRRQLTIDLGANETVSEFPVLVILKPERIDYGSTKPAGEDLRFTSDGGEVLAHEIEHWEAGQTSFVWVKLPEITQTGASKTKFWMYYGNSSAAEGQDVAAVWSSFRGVWHLHETGGDLKDSSGNTMAATNHGTKQVSAKIGMGRSFSSAMKSYVDTHHVEDLSQFTIEGWIYAESDAGTGSGPNGLLMRENNYQINWDHPQIQSYAAASLHDDSLNTWVVAQYTNPVKHTWYYLAATLDDSALKAYMNGALVDDVSTGAPSPETESAKIGRHAFGQELKHFFTGIIDEVRIADAPRDAPWIASQYKSMTDANFVTFGMEQTGEYSIP